MKGKRVGVFGAAAHAAKKVEFLRTYSSSVTLVPDVSLSDEDRTKYPLIHISAAPNRMKANPPGIEVRCVDGKVLNFDVLYPALGCVVHSDLAMALGGECNEVGCLKVNDKQQTAVAGLYAAGDVVSDLHQIVVAEGHAAIAATAIHNSLPMKWLSDEPH
jgi:thioredoxin reductase (NADPH)